MTNTNSTVAALFAAQSKASARSSNGNFHFDGDVIFSYSTPLARLFTDVRGNRAALVSVDRYSVTTNGKHFPAIFRQLRAKGVRAFSVPFIGYKGGRHTLDTLDEAEMHRNNLHALRQAYTDAMAAAKAARKEPTDIAERLQTLAGEAVAYANAFDLFTAGFDLARDLADIETTRAARIGGGLKRAA